MPMTKINLYVDEELWKAFRLACLERDLSASKLFSMFMKAQLDNWHAAKEPQSHD